MQTIYSCRVPFNFQTKNVMNIMSVQDDLQHDLARVADKDDGSVVLSQL